MRENECGHCCFARILLSEATSPSFSLPLSTAVAGDVSHRRRAPSPSFSLHPSVLTPPIHPRPCFITSLQQVAAAADPSTHSDTDDECYQSSSGIPPDNEGGGKLNRSHILGDDIFTLDDDEWQAHKKIAHIVLASKVFRSFMASVSKKLVGDGLLSLMLQAAKHGNVLDLEDMFMKFAFNSANTTVLGRNPNSLSLSSATNEISKAIDDGTEGVFHRHIMPKKLWKLLGWLGVGSEGRLARARKIINRHLLEHISLKREEMRKGAQGSDLIAMYMNSQAQNGESKAYSDLFLRDIALGFLFAEQDLTGTSLTWFLWLVSTTPHMEEKILDELMWLKKKKEAEGVVRDQKQPWVFDSEDLKDLVYFHAAMCESLRLNPPLPLTRRGVIKEDVPPNAEGEDLEEREWGLKVRGQYWVFKNLYRSRGVTCA